MRCVSDTKNENTQSEETAIAPLGGASPQSVESVSEKEKELPAVTDCTSLTLVDITQSQSALLSTQNQVFGEDAIAPHEDTSSAAPPVAPDEECSQQPMFQEQVESPCTSLITENQVSGEEMKAYHEGTSSAAPVTENEKWSSSAIAARSKMRPLRMEKLKMAGVLGENPSFEFLMECWNDDPALQIVIKKLLAKFGQWGIACVNGVLVKWEG
ncbi:hypothetical protein FNW02_30675 [Komarekiella sp. 'clone 1']|uniref:Uncharacterized protein n=1 Tax=Komarekiella delphini-convector SJRDD-AB1 TaxID=2593771 RepID=A0AA40T3L1_9NOST|nr:hypothetical protein [Komarekiella delphini-convector SJRDD-AB1]